MRIVAGIDVSKASLDRWTLGKSETLPNDAKGHARIAAWCKRAKVDQVVMEATGSYHLALANHLVGCGIAVSVVNPAWPHFFAKSQGKRNKTDRVDARLLSE